MPPRRPSSSTQSAPSAPSTTCGSARPCRSARPRGRARHRAQPECRCQQEFLHRKARYRAAIGCRQDISQKKAKSAMIRPPVLPSARSAFRKHKVVVTNEHYAAGTRSVTFAGAATELVRARVLHPCQAGGHRARRWCRPVSRTRASAQLGRYRPCRTAPIAATCPRPASRDHSWARRRAKRAVGRRRQAATSTVRHDSKR